MRSRFGPALPPTWREDIANATDWHHIGVNVDPNLNLTNILNHIITANIYTVSYILKGRTL